QELSFIDLRKEIRADITQGQQGDGTDEQGHGDQQRLQFVVQGPFQDGSNFSCEPGKSGLELMDDLSEERLLADELQLSVPGEQPGHYGEGHQQREQGGDDHRDTELGDDIGYQSAAHGDRQEHHHDHQGDGSHGEADLLGAIIGCPHLVLPHFHVAVNVFDHHDGIIHQDPHHQRQGQEAHQVQAVSHQIHSDEGGDERGGDGNHHYERISVAVKEEQHHEGYQPHRDEKVLYNGVCGRQGEYGRVVGEFDLYSLLGVLLFDLGDLLLYQFTHGHGISLCLF